MKRCLSALFSFFLLFWCACDGDIFNDAEQAVVIEGWIEDSQHPYFFVTRSLSAKDVYRNYSDLDKKNLIKDAVITIKDGDRSFILHTDSTDGLYIPICYTSEDLVGKAGMNYTVSINIDGQEISSETSIPSSEFEGYVEVVETDFDGCYALKLHVSSLGKEEYGRVFVKIAGLTDGYLLSPGSFIKSQESTEQFEVSISRPNLQVINNSDSYFHPGEQVQIRVSMMNPATYLMWEEYEKRLELSRNPLFPFTTNLDSMFGREVLGYWTGYNSYYYDVIIDK